MRSEDSVYFSAEEGDPSAHESHGAANQRPAQFPRPLKLSVFQDPDEDADGDITLRGHSPAQIYNESHRTKDEMPVQIPRPPQFSLFEDSDEDACENKGKGKRTAESLRFPHHDISDADSDVGDKTITLTHTPLPASKEQDKGGDVRAAKFPRPLQLSLATQSPRVGCLDATSSLRGTPDPTRRNGATDHTPVTRRDLNLFKETMEVGLTNVVKETMTRVIEEIVQTWGPAGYNTDEEDSEVSPHKKRRLKGQPRHRQPDINLFHKNIREHALRLMHRTQWDSPFTDVPTKAEVEVYKPALGLSCTSDRFRVDLSAVPSADWNKSAAHVFVQSFRDAYPDCAKSSKDICVAWERHFNRLRQIYRDHQERAWLAQVELARTAAGHPADPGNMKTSSETLHQTRRCQERKSHLYLRRLHVAKLYSQQHPSAVRAIEELGVSGMSSDDSDHESGGGAARYTIVSKDWRSGEVTELLRLLDALHLRLRYRNNWNATSGAWPHLRLISHKSSTRAAVKGLPRNFYARRFLVSLTQEAFDELHSIEETLLMGIPDGLREFVRFPIPHSFSELEIIY
ncbi:hypothetical protein PISMIDRAFT_16809 [Pisolithus microcarpus 441]|uniref:Unplaced genomic scaffold scaffold_225, whole genome shotgun sequence n=1 Tax=Pisolithus microcarpus 441 TaxID=765257 RepID=A0A0C9YY30_9AGAM|nr:hypothetical protein PISMIDRAFT_16809 [Pisolithus microcarpus 441]